MERNASHILIVPMLRMRGAITLVPKLLQGVYKKSFTFTSSLQISLFRDRNAVRVRRRCLTRNRCRVHGFHNSHTRDDGKNCNDKYVKTSARQQWSKLFVVMQFFQETVNTFVTPITQTAYARNEIRKAKKRKCVFKELIRRWGEIIWRNVFWTSATGKMEVGRRLKTPVNIYKSTIRLNPHEYRCEKVSRVENSRQLQVARTESQQK